MYWAWSFMHAVGLVAKLSVYFMQLHMEMVEITRSRDSALRARIAFQGKPIFVADSPAHQCCTQWCKHAEGEAHAEVH